MKHHIALFGRKPNWSFLGTFTLILLLIFSCSFFSLNFTREVGRVSSLWPANAIVLFFLLKNKNPRCILGYLAAGFIGNLLARMSISHDYMLITGLSLTNSFEIILAFGLIHFFLREEFNIHHYKHLVILGFSVCIAPLCAGVLAGTLLDEASQGELFDSWLIWFLSHSLGLAIFTPLLLIFRVNDIKQLFIKNQRLKTLSIFALTIIVLALVFYQNSYPILFLPIAVLVLAAFHLEMVGTSVCLGITAIIAVYATTHHHGPLSLVQGTLTQRILIMQLFLGVTVMLTLPVASVVTQRLRLQKSFLKAKQDAEKASHAKSDFLTSMSHELRTPLNSILGFAQLLILNEKSNFTDKDRSYLNYILNGGDYLLKLINDVLDLARIEAGKIYLTLHAIDCKDAIKSLVTTLQPLADKNDIIIETIFHDSVPSLEADTDRLMQVLINLGSNAIKYNRPQGKVTITVEPRDSVVRITVADTGHGIPANKQDGLFEPFNRLGAEKGAIEGTGIGLAISKRLVEAMNGIIGFQSDKNGTSFWIELANATPLYKTDAHFEEAIKLLPQSLEVKILYVEDNPANRVLMTQMIKDFLNIDLLLALNVHDGLDMAKTNKPDLIITDIHLPDGTGFDLLKAIRKEKSLSHIPVIAVTADAMETTRDKIKQAGFDASYTKPFQVAHVIQTIQRLLKPQD